MDKLAKDGRKFDAVMAVEVVEHLYDADLDARLDQVKSLLAPGGYAIMTTPNDEDLQRNMILCPKTGELFHRWQHVRSWTAASLGAALAKRGFRGVETIETNMAVRRPKSPVDWLKQQVKHRLLGPPGTPHLVCIATQADA